MQARPFAEMLEQTIRRYQNRAIEAAQVIEELIQLAKQMRKANARGEVLGLSEDKLAFYVALETKDSAVNVLSDDTLRAIARELSRRCVTTSRSTGRCARMCVRSYVCSSSASSASVVIRRTSRSRRHRRCWSKQPCFPGNGRPRSGFVYAREGVLSAGCKSLSELATTP